MIQVLWGVPGRAYLTVPPEVEIVPSKMANAGLGVVSKTFIPKYAWLGEYEGLTMLPGEEDYTSVYAWSVSIVNKIAKNVQESNWKIYKEKIVMIYCSSLQ